ncbi:hypothetical protein QFC19_007440 [Naganishia cerealis]|uniref:Uncharacterized protein n=1 Tax=Naganishia cerealis TaxID=610337 RepID=A0ACC2V9P0_9TREE|nr:hypothetical protein QFC19_007440 [Naganishia cerealis]
MSQAGMTSCGVIMSALGDLTSPNPSTLRRRATAQPSGVASEGASSPFVKQSVETKQHVVKAPPPTSTAAVSPIAALWLRSRQPTASTGTTFLPPGEDRPLTPATVKLAIHLIPLLWKDFAALFWQRHPVRLVAFLLGKLVKGVLPSFKIWAAAALLDLVQESFVSAAQAKPVDQAHVLQLAAVSLLASAGNTIFNFVSSTNDTLVRQYLTHHVESLYLSAQLSLDIPTLSDPLVSALMYEAGCFAGFESRHARPSTTAGGPMGKMMGGGKRRSRPSPFTTLSTFFSILTTSVEVFSAGSLLARTLRQAVRDDPMILQRRDATRPFPYNILPSESLLLIVLAFLPACLSIIGTFFALSLPTGHSGASRASSTSEIQNNFSRSEKWKRKAAQKSSAPTTTWQETLWDIQDVRDLGRNGAYKQEVVLFGLKDWVLAKWEGLREVQMRDELQSMNQAGVYLLGFGVAEEMVQTGFYVS